MSMDAREFGYIQHLVRARSGIVLETGKEYLAESRLLPLARHEGFDSVAELIRTLRTARIDGLHRKVVEAMTTNETSFFRDPPAFAALAERVLPSLIGRREESRRLRCWSAACSSGQEPYSLAMLLLDRFPALGGWDVLVLASDISEPMLETGRAGRYGQIEVNRGLPARLLVEHFRRFGLEWEVGEHVRRLVEFRRINLAEPWPAIPTMDLILMRNVLIYFDAETRRSVLYGARRLLREDGWLLLGGAETPVTLDDAFEAVDFGGALLYRPRGR